MKTFLKTFSYLYLAFALFFFPCCSGPKKEIPRIQLAEGTSLPAVNALAWLVTEDSAACDRFVSFTEDGLARTWEISSGRMISVCSAVPSAEAADRGSPPLYSPDGSKKLLPGKDGAVCLLNSATDKEIARYYGFGPDEWVSIVPEGFYNSSFQGSSFLAAEAGKLRYNLAQLSGGLFRPDLFRERVSATMLSNGPASEAPLTLTSIFEDECQPPLVSLGKNGELQIKITEQKGGAGWLALYRRDDGSEERVDIPVGLFDVEKTADKKYSEKGRTGYEIRLNPDLFPGSGKIGVSAFNKFNTVESERLWVEHPAGQGTAGQLPEGNPDRSRRRAPVLKVLLGSGDDGQEDSEALGNSLSRQNEGDLYSAVEKKSLFGNDFTRLNFIQSFDRLCAGTLNNDTVILYLRGNGRSDSLGNLRILPGNSENPENEISWTDILERILSLPSNSILLILDLDPGDLEQGKLETALLRFRLRLGPKAMLAAYGPPDREKTLAGDILAKLNPAFQISSVGISDSVGTSEDVSASKYIGVNDILAYAGRTQAEWNLAFFPQKDFPIVDPLINAGELRFQTMTSGMLKIDRVDANPIPLIFGETMIRTLPVGSYIIDMFYRNGYRETRTVELRGKDNKWVVFSYTPALLTGAFPGGLPSNGINIAELNPANYQKINREAMEGMGMAPYYVAFLAGEKFYKDEDYTKAIAEYSRAVSLKSDYADAYVSRGNARRKTGDLNRAIEDYNRALSLKSSYAEVYNYRGFAYAKKGDLNRAIADYTQAIRYKADYADAYFNRAYSYGEQGNWDRAIADYTQVIKFEPSNGIAYNQRGSVWLNKGDASKADADFAVAEKLGGR